MSGLPAKSADPQRVPSVEAPQQLANSLASPEEPHSRVLPMSVVNHPGPQDDMAPDFDGETGLMTHQGTSITTAPKSEAIRYVETLLHSSAEKEAVEDAPPTATPAPVVNHMPGDAAPMRAVPSLPNSDHWWWLVMVVVSLVLLGTWLMRRRKASPCMPDQLELQLGQAPEPQEFASVAETLHENLVDVPPALLSSSAQLSPAMAASEDAASYAESLVARETVQASVVSLPSRTEHVDPEPLRENVVEASSLLPPTPTEPPLVIAASTSVIESFVPRAAVQVALVSLPVYTEQVSLASARDLRRARTLLQRGELDAALASVSSCLHELRCAPVASDTSLRPQVLPDAVHLDESHPTARATAALYADICWQLARRSRSGADHAQAVCALEAYLAFRPEDVTARLRLARSLLDLSERQTNAVTQESFRRYCIDILFQRLKFDLAQEQALLALLGEVLCRSALQAPVIDPADQAEAEKLLREAIAMGPMEVDHAAWWLQQSLTTVLPGMKQDVVVARLGEAIALLREGVQATAAIPECSRWQAALLRAELKQAQWNPSSVLELRLRLRALHDRHADQMQAESSPNVLAAWVELLCAMADPLVGVAAKTRYSEIDGVLDRLSVRDNNGQLHALAWMHMAQGRLRVETHAGRRNLLQRVETLFAPSLDNADAALRIEASRLALAQAVQEDDPEAKQAAYAKALEFALPMVDVTPALAASALQCALKVALALDQDEQRRTYAASLIRLMPDDIESLSLLAMSAQRDGAYAAACRYFEQAAQKPAVLSSDLLALWQNASTSWAGQGSKDAGWQANHRQLRWAASRCH
jgi:hypothetical protein